MRLGTSYTHAYRAWLRLRPTGSSHRAMHYARLRSMGVRSADAFAFAASRNIYAFPMVYPTAHVASNIVPDEREPS